MATTRLSPTATPGRNYAAGAFAAKTPAPPTGVVTVFNLEPAINFDAGDEWYVTLSGPAIDAPKVRISIRYS
jgi:hypothetical protein